MRRLQDRRGAGVTVRRIISKRETPAPPPPPEASKWSASLGPWYGYNLKETDRNDDLTSNLLGLQGTLAYNVSPNVPVRVDLTGFNTIGTAHNDGWGGRATVGADYSGHWRGLNPFIGGFGGYILGSGIQDGVIIGPEVGLKFDLAKDLFGYAKIAYDYNFRNDWDERIPNGGIGVGYRW